MSTRSRIIFTDGTESVSTYRHSDGYPEGVLPDLTKFQEWLTGLSIWGKDRNDLEYIVANWFYWAKTDTHLSLCIRNGEPCKGWCTLGYGVCSHERHGDEEYEYTVNVSKYPFNVETKELTGDSTE